jgi:predicted component of type VI protein secretion system
MSLTLRAVLLDDRPLSRPLEACFDGEGGTIGRADHNTLALPDPLRYISRRQARVSRTPGGFVIENIGSADPMAVRGQPLPHGHSVPLRHRDQLRIGPYLLEAVEEPGNAVPVPAAPLPEPAPGLDAGLWSAFCEGAGVRFEADPSTTAERLHAAGRLLRHAVAGLLELLCVQPLPPCTPRGGSSALSNPLKVAPDAQAALELLLLPPLRGFLDGPQAMAEALEELLAQASATGAGTRAAREGMLRRFVPAALEDRLAAGDAAPPWWPAQRQARLWTQYCRHFGLLHDQAQADFDAFFGQAFVAAYEQRLQGLRQERNG